MKNPSQQQQPSKKKPYNDYIKYSSLGFQMVVIVAIGVIAGMQLDKHVMHNGTTWFTMGFSLVFVILAMAYMIMQLTKK